MQSILINTFPYSDEELREKNQAGVRVIRGIQELQEDKGDHQFLGGQVASLFIENATIERNLSNFPFHGILWELILIRRLK